MKCPAPLEAFLPMAEASQAPASLCSVEVPDGTFEDLLEEESDAETPKPNDSAVLEAAAIPMTLPIVPAPLIHLWPLPPPPAAGAEEARPVPVEGAIPACVENILPEPLPAAEAERVRQ